jgi:hypothetical protein
VDHQVAARATVCAIERVGVAHVEGEIIKRVGIELCRRDRIETFRRLPIPFLDFRSQLAGPTADRIRREQRETPGIVLLPDLEFGLLFEQPDQDRGFLGHVLALELRKHRGRQGLKRLR